MSLNGSGVMVINSSGQPVVAGTSISASVFNAFTADVATALSTCIMKDGQQTVTANIPMSTYKFTGLGAGSARTDSASLANVQDGTGVYVATVGGTADVITLTASPAITSYAAGQTFRFIASGANTTNVTVAVSGLTAKAITKNGTTALVAGDIASGSMVCITYDGTRFILGTVMREFLPIGGGTLTGNLLFTDATYDIGASGATRPRDFFLSRNAVIGGTLNVTGTMSPLGLLDASGASAGQIKFPATQNASADANTLDDYEEGTWTPSLGGNTTYTNQTGIYVKIGKLVYVKCLLDINAIGTGSKTTISGLPFAAGSDGALSNGENTGLLIAAVSVNPVVSNGLSTITIRSRTVGNAANSVTDILTSSSHIIIAGTYTV